MIRFLINVALLTAISAFIYSTKAQAEMPSVAKIEKMVLEGQANLSQALQLEEYREILNSKVRKEVVDSQKARYPKFETDLFYFHHFELGEYFVKIFFDYQRSRQCYLVRDKTEDLEKVKPCQKKFFRCQDNVAKNVTVKVNKLIYELEEGKKKNYQVYMKVRTQQKLSRKDQVVLNQHQKLERDIEKLKAKFNSKITKCSKNYNSCAGNVKFDRGVSIRNEVCEEAYGRDL